MSFYWEENQKEVLINLSREKYQMIEDLAVEFAIDSTEDLISFLVTGNIPSKDIAKAIPSLSFSEDFYEFLFSSSVGGIAVSKKIRFADEQKARYEKYLFCLQLLSRIFGVRFCEKEITEEGIILSLEWDKVEEEKDWLNEKQKNTIKVDPEYFKKKEKEVIAIATIMNGASSNKWELLQDLRQRDVI